MWAVLVGPCAHHVAPSTEYPECLFLFVVELGERIDPGDKLVYGVAESPTPTVSDEKVFIIKVEAAPINPSDLGSVGMTRRVCCR